MSFAGDDPSSSSPNLSSFSSLSDNISHFLRIKKAHNVGELDSYSRLSLVVSHWTWACGMRKGQKLDKSHAEALLRLKHFDKNLLEPVYVSEPNPLHYESLEIQNMLGAIKVSEYGSFVDETTTCIQ